MLRIERYIVRLQRETCKKCICKIGYVLAAVKNSCRLLLCTLSLFIKKISEVSHNLWRACPDHIPPQNQKEEIRNMLLIKWSLLYLTGPLRFLVFLIVVMQRKSYSNYYNAENQWYFIIYSSCCCKHRWLSLLLISQKENFWRMSSFFWLKLQGMELLSFRRT